MCCVYTFIPCAVCTRSSRASTKDVAAGARLTAAQACTCFGRGCRDVSLLAVVCKNTFLKAVTDSGTFVGFGRGYVSQCRLRVPSYGHPLGQGLAVPVASSASCNVM